MPTWKLVLVYAGWLLAAAAIALLGGLLVGEMALAVNLIDSGDTVQKLIVEAVAVVIFVLLAALPSLLRNRVLRAETPDQDH